MNISQLVKQWEESGNLEDEFKQMSAILAEKQYTREQIRHCFDSIMEPICVLLQRDTGVQPTLEDFKEEIQRVFSERTQLLEACMSITYSAERPAIEVARDFQRQIENRKWEIKGMQ